MKIADSHNDFLTAYRTKQEILNYLYRLNNTDIKIINAVFWTTETNKPKKAIEKYRKILDNNAFQNKILFTLEDIDFVEISDINFIKNNRVDFCGLVWNKDNSLGGGAFGINNLSHKGKAIVERLEKNNIIIDTAHMNFETFDSFTKITKKPLYNSHANIYKVLNHNRNLKDSQIYKIVKTNGFLGVIFVKSFIKNDSSANIKDIAFQFKYLIDNFGDENFGIGSDFYGSADIPANLNTYSKFENLKKELLSLDISENSINKIFYENYYNFLKRVGKL